MLYSLKDDSFKLMVMFSWWWTHIDEIIDLNHESYKKDEREYFLLFVETENFKKDTFFDILFPYSGNISYMLLANDYRTDNLAIKTAVDDFDYISSDEHHIIPVVLSYQEKLYESEKHYPGRGSYCLDLLSTEGAEAFSFRFEKESERTVLFDKLANIGVEF